MPVISEFFGIHVSMFLMIITLRIFTQNTMDAKFRLVFMIAPLSRGKMKFGGKKTSKR